MTVLSCSERSQLSCYDPPCGDATKQEMKGGLWPKTSEKLKFSV